MYFYILYFISFWSYDKNNFHKKLQFCEGGTILNFHFSTMILILCHTTCTYKNLNFECTETLLSNCSLKHLSKIRENFPYLSHSYFRWSRRHIHNRIHWYHRYNYHYFHRDWKCIHWYLPNNANKKRYNW